MSTSLSQPLTLRVVQKVFPEAMECIAGSGLEFKVHCRNGHKKGGHYKMYINAQSGLYHCQDCKDSGDAVYRWFDALLGANGMLTVVRDADEAPSGRFFAKAATAPKWRDDIASPGGITPMEDLPSSHPALEYLEERGFSRSDYANPESPFHLFYCHRKGPLDIMRGRCTTLGRIIFPIEMGGKLLGWTSRYIDRRVSDTKRLVWTGEGWKQEVLMPGGKWSDDQIPKYFALPGMKKSRVLYGWDGLKGLSYAVASEGPLDAMAIGEGGVAYMQNIISEYQARLLSRFKHVVWITDATGVDRGKQFRAAKLAIGGSTSLVEFSLSGELPCGSKIKDPGDLADNRPEIWRQIGDAVMGKSKPVDAA